MPWAEPRGAVAILLLLALAALGATLAPGGWRHRTRRSRRLIAGAVLLGAALSLVWPGVAGHSVLDVNPSSISSSQLMGAWHFGADSLRLGPGSTYSCSSASCFGLGASGTWDLRPGNVVGTRRSDGHEVEWRVVTYRGQLRLGVAPPGGDTQSWDGRLFWQHD